MIKIYSILYNEPQFINLQYLTFKKYLHQQFEFIVVNNAPTPVLHTLIEAESDISGVQHIEVQNPRHDEGGLSHQRAVDFILKELILKDDKTNYSVITDADIFPINNISILQTRETPEYYDFMGLNQGTVDYTYLWLGLFIMYNGAPNLETLDLRGALVDKSDYTKFVVPDPLTGWTWEHYSKQIQTMIPLDSGGLFCKYYKENPQIKIKYFSLEFIEELNKQVKLKVIPGDLLHLYNDAFRFWLIDGTYLHTGRISNWDNRPAEEVNSKKIFIKKLLEYYLQ